MYVTLFQIWHISQVTVYIVKKKRKYGFTEKKTKKNKIKQSLSAGCEDLSLKKKYNKSFIFKWYLNSQMRCSQVISIRKTFIS